MGNPRGDWMQTFSGGKFYPLSPRVSEVVPADIAHALSLICRFGGHSQSFYSVAEHSILLSRSVSPENALWALLHDATEAYIGDMIRPLKYSMSEYRAAELVLMRVICERFGLDPDFPLEVQEADNRILLDERYQVMGPSRHKWPTAKGLEPLGIDIHLWSPNRAEILFTQRLKELTHSS